MARILKPAFGRQLSVSLDGNVGPRGGNERGDVGVVQFALLLLSSGIPSPAGGRSGGGLEVPGQGTIAVDGFFGPQTSAFIRAYQARRVLSPGPTTGKLPNPDGNFGNFQRNPWNFGLLQTDVESALPGTDFLDRMRSDPRAPAFLKPFFFI
jgi:peptidoglycan hydrolase-like protein with peptidoglycan-binding domain